MTTVALEKAETDLNSERIRHEEAIEQTRATNQAEQQSRDNAMIAEQLINPSAPTLMPMPEDAKVASDGTLTLEFTQARWNGAFFLLSIQLTIPHGRPYRLADSRIVSSDGNAVPAEISFTRTDSPPPDGLLAQVESGAPVTLVIAADLTGKDSTDGLTLHLSEPDGRRPVTAPIPDYRDGRILWPIGPKEKARIQAEEERQRLEKERQRRGKQMIVSVQGFYGAYFMRDGVGQGETEVTSMSGLGVRVTQGFIPEFALEAELAAGTTGSAQWDDIAIDGVTGELTREAWLGRAMVSAVGRMDDKVNPYIRIGIGVQVAGHDAEFSAGTDPGSKTEFTYFLGFGGGGDLRMAENFILGAALNFTPGQESEAVFRSSFQAGLHLAYAWTR
ncbi:MAG: hypothetical protein AAGC55_23600 [Myxococcota bacterium]